MLSDTASGVLYGLQHGSGSNYKTVQKQEGGAATLHFSCTADLKISREGVPNFLGVFCQGTPKERFLYIDIGTYSEHTDSISGGRLKIPLYGISQEMLSAIREGSTLETTVSAIGKGGRPAFGTVKPFAGWMLVD